MAVGSVELAPRTAGGDDPVSIAKAKDWSDTAEDEAFARVVWGKFSDRAKSMFGTLMDSPEQKFSGEDLAVRAVLDDK